jgi:hypothetical protein
MMKKYIESFGALVEREGTHFIAGVHPHMFCTESIEKFLMR